MTKTTGLTEMQQFFLDTINNNGDKVFNASHLAYLWYEHKGISRKGASRDAFGQTSAAYRTIRKLHEMGLVNMTPRENEAYKKPLSTS